MNSVIAAVIGQILAGIVLGLSLLGRLPGHLTGHLFPSDALPYLNVLSQVAVVIFMFGVGYEIEFGTLRAHGQVVPPRELERPHRVDRTQRGTRRNRGGGQCHT